MIILLPLRYSIASSTLHLLPLGRLPSLPSHAPLHSFLHGTGKSLPHMGPSHPSSFHSIPPRSPPSPTVSPPKPSQIRRRSQAGRAGLRERDQLLAINGVSCTSLSHASAMSLIDASGTQLVLTVQRYGLLTTQPIPSPYPVPLLPDSLCISLAWLQQLTRTYFCSCLSAGI